MASTLYWQNILYAGSSILQIKAISPPAGIERTPSFVMPVQCSHRALSYRTVADKSNGNYAWRT